MHQVLITLLGHQSQREVLRARFRVAAAMRAQVPEQGRHLGGRPPYGYRLMDAGPHTIEASAEVGQLRADDWTPKQVAELLRARNIDIRCDVRGITLSGDDSTTAGVDSNTARRRRTPTKHVQEI